MTLYLHGGGCSGGPATGAFPVLLDRHPHSAESAMQKVAGMVLLVVGVILLVFGFLETDSIASNFKEFFTGTPTDKSVWFIIAGAAAAVLGFVLTLIGRAPRGV
jgi:Protein of unknown function (DUF3185)